MPILKEMPTFPFIDLFNVVVVPLDLAPDLAPLPVHRTFLMIDPIIDIGISLSPFALLQIFCTSRKYLILTAECSCPPFFPDPTLS